MARLKRRDEDVHPYPELTFRCWKHVDNVGAFVASGQLFFFFFFLFFFFLGGGWAVQNKVGGG